MRRNAHLNRAAWTLAGALAIASGFGLLVVRRASAQDVAEGIEGKPIREIRFEGDILSSVAFLREQVRSKVGQPFRSALLDQDVRRLYLSGRVSGDVEAVPRLVAGGVVITFFVTERRVVREIVYDGLEEFSEDELRETPAGLRLRVGRPYEAYRARLDERTMKEMLATKGKIFAEIDREVQPLKGAGARVVFKVKEGPTVRVDEIRFRGNKTLTAEKLHKHMKTQTSVLYVIRSGYFQRSDLELDLERLKVYYRSEGFLDVEVFLGDLTFSEDRSDVKIRIDVVEGSRYRVREVSVEGATLFSKEALLRDLKTKPGEFFSGMDLEGDVRRIEHRYADRGYIFSRARYQRRVVADKPAIDLRFDVAEGERIAVERIRIEGNTKTRDDVIRRDLSLLPGETFSAQKLDDSRDRLGRRGLYKDVAVRFEDGTAPDRRDVVLRVEEGDTGQLLFGGGISSSSGIFGRFVFQQRNFDIAAVPTSLDDVLNGYAFAGGGQRLTLQAEPGTQRSSYRLTFVEPYLFPSLIPIPLQLRTSFTYSDSVLARTYVEQRLEGSVGLGYRIGRDTLIELGYRGTNVDIFDIDANAPADVVAVAGNSLISALSLGLRVDQNQIDQYFLGYGGWGLDLAGELAGVGGDHDFWTVELRLNAQHTLFQWPGSSRHVLAARAAFGFGRPFGRSGSIPVFERYYAGGPRSVRGFRVRSVGPQADNEPIGGHVRMTGTVEYSFPIIPGLDETYAPQWRGDFLRGIFFLDAGNVEPNIEDLTLDDFRVSAGFGVRIKIPIFPQPLALDFGFPLRMQSQDDREIFSLSIDTPF